MFVILAGCSSNVSRETSLDVCPKGYFLSGSKCYPKPFKAEKCPEGMVKVNEECYIPGIYYTEE